MQTKKQNPLLAGLFIILALGFTALMIISIIRVFDWIDYMSAEGIIVTFATLIGQYFVFAVPAFALAAYFLNMGAEKNIFTAIRFSVSGWVILFIEVVYAFISTLINDEFVFENLLSVLLTLLPLVVTSILYVKKDAYGNNLNGARIASVVYFLYLGVFNWLYTVIKNAIPGGAEGTISFILSILLGVAIPGAFCYYYFKLGNTSQPQQYGPQNNYGYGPQQPYGQQYGQQNGPLQQFRQQNGYAAPDAPVPPVPPVQQAPAAKFCTSCGSQVDPNAAFCNNCGNKLQ